MKYRCKKCGTVTDAVPSLLNNSCMLCKRVNCMEPIDNPGTPIDTRSICIGCHKPVNHKKGVEINGDTFHMECTPEGDPDYDQHEPGAKLDLGKVRLGLVMGGFARAFHAVGEVGTFGANKYSDNGWMEVPNGINRYTDAMLRHLNQEQWGNDIDEETELLHAAAVAWNALARLDLILRDLEHETESTSSTSRIDIIGQNGNDGEHYES